MAYPVPTFEQTRNRYLQAVVNQWPDAAIGPDSDHFVRATAVAAVAEGIYAHQSWVYRQAFPDLADVELMEKMANQRTILRKAAAAAGGVVRFFGTAGTPVTVGQQVFTAQSVYVQVTTAGVIGGGGSVDLAASAVVAGAAGNQSPNTSATVNAPPAGITGTATILTMTGGADVESDDSLLARLLLWLSEEAQGGNAIDFKRWALAVPGVSRAYVFDCRRGAGTVDVVPMPVVGLATAPLLAAVQAVLDVKRPVGMRNTSPVLALAGTPIVTAVTASFAIASGYTLAGLLPALTAAIDSVFAALAPGQTLVRNELITALMNVPGVTDVTLVSPAANVTSSVTSLALEIVTCGLKTLT
ncbi:MULTISPECIES: baseplate J/gp47 family protein [unclassified Variovorax]|uniref:baseplate J/gp47 family protein n=1 Tax=unclassified Variovorax TaxID=663243 RepID=UPI003F486550